MANHRPEISNQAKKRLRAEAAHKCANPGCSNARTHIHHIKEWAAYQSHDEAHMVAVCPACHDAIHHGTLAIDDETVYRWKTIERQPTINRAHLYVEPGESQKLLLGSIAVQSSRGAMAVFDRSPGNRLKFEIRGEEIVLLDCAVETIDGTEIVRVDANYVRANRRDDVVLRQVPGAVEVTVPFDEDFLPSWAQDQMRREDPTFGAGGVMKALALTVIQPGLVRVEGVWADHHSALIVTDRLLCVLNSHRPKAFVMTGEGEHSVLMYDPVVGVNLPLFRL